MNFELKDFRVGDVLILTGRNKFGESRNEVFVTCLNYNGNGLVTYAPMPGSGAGQGAFKPEEVGAKPFGFHCAVEKTDRNVNPFPSMLRGPRPGDRGYDLMC